jgi:hypothetical protein
VRRLHSNVAHAFRLRGAPKRRSRLGGTSGAARVGATAASVRVTGASCSQSTLNTQQDAAPPSTRIKTLPAIAMQYMLNN